VIAAFLAIAAVGALIGTWIHTEPSGDPVKGAHR
jgi:hypothetical protein